MFHIKNLQGKKICEIDKKFQQVVIVRRGVKTRIDFSHPHYVLVEDRQLKSADCIQERVRSYKINKINHL